MKCKDLLELWGCKNWLNETCEYLGKATGECRNNAKLRAVEEIMNCLADSNSG